MITLKSFSVAGATAAVTLTAGLVAGAAPASAETAQPLPQFTLPSMGSASFLLSSPSTCEKLQNKSAEIQTEWQKAVAAGEIYKADQLRVDFTNTMASWSQCMLAANKWFFNPLGS
ncbi:hypothetical protein [Corynebacterium auriscanis]|uniref:hypothetical protein n=1 Tax=Corynebacterium auriscanis TaxID=99807 RepID=UPI003CF84C06